MDFWKLPAEFLTNLCQFHPQPRGTMKKSLIALFLLIALSLVTAACGGQASNGPKTVKPFATNTPVPDLLGREKLSAYTATFLIDFDGPVKWKYQLITRKAPTLRETTLHIEGIAGAQNPGDVRMVTDGVTTWMKGPGTDEECVQYPNNTGMDPNLVYPEALISMESLPSLAKFVREEPVAGRDTRYYMGGPTTIGKWQNASVEYHQQKDSGALLQFAMLAGGEDILFNTGRGTMLAAYSIDSFDTPAIEPVTGCEIDVPLPESASKLVRLPGLISFESKDGTDAMRDYYQQALSEAGWQASEGPAQSGETMMLSYINGSRTLEVHITRGDEGTSVKLVEIEK
jgi:hypothetical protein